MRPGLRPSVRRPGQNLSSSDRVGGWLSLDGHPLPLRELLPVGRSSKARSVSRSTYAPERVHSLVVDGRIIDVEHPDIQAVLSFIRGGWCPYCASELRNWNATLPDLQAAGGRLALVSSVLKGKSGLLADIVGPEVDALCDVDHGIALQLGLAFYMGPKLLAAYRDYGVDFEELYGGVAGMLSVPATYVIGKDRIIEFAFVEPDFRYRAEPQEIVRIVASLRGRDVGLPWLSTPRCSRPHRTTMPARMTSGAT